MSKELPFNDNMPHGIKDPADVPEPRMKDCDECVGTGMVSFMLLSAKVRKVCANCKGEGKVPMTFEEQDELQQEKNEPNDL